MNDYDKQVHRSARDSGIFVMTILTGFAVFWLLCDAVFTWWNS